ncbi:MAG: hypothetical protein ABIO55_05465 [Ginsengibacter sp.]
MKTIKSATLNVKNFIVLLVLSLCQTAVWAQDAGGADVNVKITKDDGNWYAQPWVWIVGGAVFLLLLVALLRGNSNKS